MSKLVIEHKDQVPQGGQYKYRQPETGEWIRSYLWDALLASIRRYRKEHGIPIGLGLAEEVEQQVCANQPEICIDIDPAIPRVERLGMWDIVRGTTVMAAFKTAGSPVETQEEANRRAAICAKCRFNVVFNRPCGGICGKLKELVQSIIGNLKTPYDNELKSCSICKCYTSAHVWLPIDILDKGLTDDMRKQFRAAQTITGCWKVTAPASGGSDGA